MKLYAISACNKQTFCRADSHQDAINKCIEIFKVTAEECASDETRPKYEYSNDDSLYSPDYREIGERLMIAIPKREI